MVNEQLPPFPLELRKSAYINRPEENRMGVELMATIKFRKTYGLDVYSGPMEFQSVMKRAWRPWSRGEGNVLFSSVSNF